MYTEKVIEYFQHPRNVGVIENADGSGKVGNPICGDIMLLTIKVGENKGEKIIEDIKFKTMGCLPPTEKIIIRAGTWVDISNISENDIALNTEGEKTKIKLIHENIFKGELIHIIPFVSRFNSFYVTPLHPILCIKRGFLNSSRKSSKKCDWLRVEEEELISTEPYYVEAAYIEPGDYLIFPKRKGVKDSKKFTKKLMRLLGYHLAEGYVTSDYVLNFSFNKNEKEEVEEVKKLLKEITGKSGTQRIRKNVAEIRVCSTKWAKFFLKIAGKYAKKKKLSPEILLLPWEKQWEMIKTYIKGDGNTYKRRSGDSVTYRLDTTSKELAIQIQEILARGDILASIKKFERPSTFIEGRELPPHTLFNISFKLRKKHKFVKENEKYFLVPVKKIERRSFSGEVYNLEMNGKSHSYLVKGFAVHNCAAAIATSSIVTEMAKGKTIEEAIKITKQDIVDELGGLPRVKVHCSILATEALNEAIYDYLTKNKLKIPEGVQERHEKIQKELEQVEKQYKDFVAAQEKILEK